MAALPFSQLESDEVPVRKVVRYGKRPVGLIFPYDTCMCHDLVWHVKDLVLSGDMYTCVLYAFKVEETKEKCNELLEGISS